ncbi:hypothetical protein GCM10011348_38750 [Marinobacterium nitratireducens]|uniref:Transglycosylase SLT domain-containing protein n=1 Tax=Marinobacterium nitratireducens TaxID=518897 RepID=A0A917ZMT5_9GAMM|nr:hypothetical protein [Marinobacterium nitratireducens]GGO86866.1 hypothetical protein GCM10011348_38750 [Marinobacterium nitratireducens]
MLATHSHLRLLAPLAGLLILGGCSSAPPRQPDNICSIFEEKKSWYDAALDMNERWGTPVYVPMAIIYQESGFRHDARPPMRWFLGIIPYGRASSAYGYSQAKTTTWTDYENETGNGWSSREDFADAIDFVGWYTHKTQRTNGVSKWDARSQYLAYHEGWGGYRNGSYRRKAWLMRVADKVDQRSRRYAAQYNQCKDDLKRGGWFF